MCSLIRLLPIIKIRHLGQERTFVGNGLDWKKDIRVVPTCVRKCNYLKRRQGLSIHLLVRLRAIAEARHRGVRWIIPMGILFFESSRSSASYVRREHAIIFGRFGSQYRLQRSKCGWPFLVGCCFISDRAGLFSSS